MFGVRLRPTPDGHRTPCSSNRFKGVHFDLCLDKQRAFRDVPGIRKRIIHRASRAAHWTSSPSEEARPEAIGIGTASPELGTLLPRRRFDLLPAYWRHAHFSAGTSLLDLMPPKPMGKQGAGSSQELEVVVPRRFGAYVTVNRTFVLSTVW